MSLTLTLPGMKWALLHFYDVTAALGERASCHAKHLGIMHHCTALGSSLELLTPVVWGSRQMPHALSIPQPCRMTTLQPQGQLHMPHAWLLSRQQERF
jgi:hypothetical protein